MDQKDDKETKSSDEKNEKPKDDSPRATEVDVTGLVVCCALYCVLGDSCCSDMC